MTPPATAAAPAPAKEAAPAAPAATAPAGAAVPASATAAATAATAVAPAAPAHPPVCEVEFAGKVQYAGKLAPNLRWIVFAVQGDCLDKEPHVLGTVATSADNSFYSEVFAKWGSDVSFCAAALTAPDQPTTLYGKAEGKFHAEAIGEVEFKHLVIVPKPGPKKVFPPVKVPVELPPPPPNPPPT